MTGPDHYAEAEEIINQVVTGGYDKSRYSDTDMLAMAQVHATLALTAANALAAVTPLTPREAYPMEVRFWRDVTGVADQ